MNIDPGINDEGHEQAGQQSLDAEPFGELRGLVLLLADPQIVFTRCHRSLAS